MTIERHASRQQICCDTCPASQARTYGQDEFDVMRADAKEEGWAFEKDRGEWQHTCPDCVQDGRRKGRLL